MMGDGVEGHGFGVTVVLDSFFDEELGGFLEDFVVSW